MIKNADIKESLEDDIKPKSKRNIKKVLERDLIDSDSFEDFNKYDINIEEISPPPRVSVKTTETRQLTEDRVKALFEEQYKRIQMMIDNKMSEYNYRMHKSIQAEIRRWYEGYYDNVQ